MGYLLSVVVPCYNEEQNVPLLYAALEEQRHVLKESDTETEYIFVDDGSKDGTCGEVDALSAQDPLVHLISLSRNFGKEAAIFAGLKEAKGDFVVVMDADLQDPPALLPEMFAAVVSGQCDSAAAYRVTRDGEPPIRSFFARAFYRIMNRFSDVSLMDGARDYRLMSREFVDAVLLLSETNRFSKGIFAWVGFDTKWFPYQNAERTAGETKWTFFKLFRYALEGLTAFSTKPLAAVSVTGLVFCFVSLLLIVAIIVKTMFLGDPVSGWPSLACIIFFVSGSQLFCTGIVGLYVSKIYSETKKRPIYIKRKSTGRSRNDSGKNGWDDNVKENGKD